MSSNNADICYTNDTSTLVEDWQTYHDGAILRLAFYNFLTYESVVCHPGRYLNLIIGHNGSGKSSIICGICLVFGGSTKNLGRSEKLNDYIRNGCTEGFVEAVVADRNLGPQIFKINLSINKHEFYHNNIKMTQAAIKNLTLKYNIQINNPCAFLAQDKVKSFSEQSAVDLLYNTEKAASSELYEAHQALIKKRQSSQTIEAQYESTCDAINQIQGDIDRLIPRVENYHKKNRLESKLKLLIQKSKILNFKNASEKLDNYRSEENKIKKQINESKLKVKELEDKQASVFNNCEFYKKNVTELKKACKNYLKEIEETIDLSALESELELIKREFYNKEDLSRRQNEERGKILIDIKNLENKFEEVKNSLENYDELMAEINEEDKSLEERVVSIRSKEDDLARKNYTLKNERNEKDKLKRKYESIRNKRMEKLETFSGDAARAWRFYEEHKRDFIAPIYIPFLHIFMKNSNAASYFENCVSNRDWCMFICSNKDDEKRINDQSRGWRINSTVIRPEMIVPDRIHSKIPVDLQELGFKNFVSELIDGPDPVKQYLCNVYALDKIPVGGSEVDRNLTKIIPKLANTRYKYFMTNNIKNQISISRYSGEVIQSQSQMRTASHWNEEHFQGDLMKIYNRIHEVKEDFRCLENEIIEENKNLDEMKKSLQRDKDLIRQKRSKLKDRKNTVDATRAILEKEKEKLRIVDRQKIDLDELKKVFDEKKSKLYKAAYEKIDKSIALQTQYQKSYLKLGKSLVMIRKVAETQNIGTSQIEDIKLKLGELSNLLDNLKNEAEESILNLKKAVVELRNQCGLDDLDSAKMSKDQKLILKKLNEEFARNEVPDESNELQNAIWAEEAKLEALTHGNEGSIDDKNMLDRLREKLQEKNVQRDELESAKSEVHGNLLNEISLWRNDVLKMISKINENYQKSFSELGCMGEVSLKPPDNELDIDNYGIMIEVSFREGEKLKRLDQRVQSGGERSVATMIYLLSLQHLCHVPFRCVDEINQGMDPTNEKKVFDMMVNSWYREGSALADTQYFLLTPKLLHGLNMNERVSLLTVHSYVLNDFKEWNMDLPRSAIKSY